MTMLCESMGINFKTPRKPTIVIEVIWWMWGGKCHITQNYNVGSYRVPLA